MTVFEAVNETLREVFVGATEHPFDRGIDEFRSRPPRAVAHWRMGERLSFRCVEHEVPSHDAERFIDGYAQSDALRGWKILRTAVPARS